MRRSTALRVVPALMIREIATSYGRTPGGYLWAVAEPLAAIMLLAAIFAVAFDSPPLGRDFALFYATGYIPFAIYVDLSQKIGVALRFSRPLMAYPAVTWADALLARLGLNLLTHALVMALVLPALLAIAGQSPPEPLLVLASFAMAAFLGFALGTVNAYLFERWPVWERLWAIVTRPAFLLSGILFLPEAIPPPFRDWLLLNPMVHVVTTMRMAVYDGYAPSGCNPLYVLYFAMIPLTIGLLLLRRDARDLMCRN